MAVNPRAPWGGLENLLVPSFTPDLRGLDEAGIRLDVRQSLAHGVGAMALAVEAGLKPDEQRRFVTIACDEAAGRLPVSILLAAPQPEAALDLLAHAEAVGASHVHLGCPSEFQPRSDVELIAWVERFLHETRLPLCLVAERYAFPQLHASGLPLDALDRLASEENIVALELASLDAGLIAECCERFGERLLVGSPHLSLQPMLAQNFGLRRSGPWPVEALQSPTRPHVVRFLDLLRLGRMDEAMQLYWTLAPALGAVARIAASFAHTGAQHWPLVKYQQWLSGGNGGVTRQPVMRMFQRDMQAIRAGLAAVGVECADADVAFFAGRGGREARAA